MSREINLLVVHCSATRPTLDVRAVDIDRWHKARGWRSIGYHYVITRAGFMEMGREEAVAGAHVAGHNRNSIGICLVGGVAENGRTPENNFRTAQFQSLITLLRELRERYPKARICGHRDLSPDKDGDGVIERGEWLKDCPCFDVAAWCASVGIEAEPA